MKTPSRCVMKSTFSRHAWIELRISLHRDYTRDQISGESGGLESRSEAVE